LRGLQFNTNGNVNLQSLHKIQICSSRQIAKKGHYFCPYHWYPGDKKQLTF
jgi:hypothetical protein